MRLTIVQRLTISFLLIAVLVGVLGIVGYSNTREIEKLVKVIGEESDRVVLLSDMKSHVLEGVEEAFAYPLLGDPLEKAEFFEDLERFDASVASFREGPSRRPQEKSEETHSFIPIVAAKAALEFSAINMFQKFERTGVINLSDVEDFESKIDDLTPLIDRFLEIENEEAAEAQEDIEAAIASAEQLTIIVVSVAVVLALGLGFFLSRSILNPINTLKDAAEDLGQGDFSVRAGVESGDEIGSLADSFNQMAAALQQAEEERGTLIAKLEGQNAEMERFTYTASHDLKSPLITIKGFLGALEEDVATGDTKRIQADMARISASADRMSNLLDELLKLSRIGRVVGSPEEVSLEELVKACLAMLAGPLEARQVQVTVAEGLPVVFGDRMRIGEVLQNIIENAVKFMGDEPHPRLDIGGLEKDGECVCFVRDNGMGIDPRYNQKVFELFNKLDRNTEGSGIGLALVKRIIEVHGGRVWVESEGYGHGSTFYFTLPSKITALRDKGIRNAR